MKKTLSAVLTSALALVICVSMLIGTTFAWFTDSAASANNKIQAGTLDIELYQWTDVDAKKDLSTTPDPVFTNDIIWEPGMTQTVYFSIKNAGNLDLKYRVSLDVTVNTPHALTDVMSYVITPDAKFGDVTAWAGNGTYVIPGHNATEAAATPLYAIQNGVNEHFFALSIHMDESATNEYMGDAITFDIKVDAAQLASEPDGFNNPNYDKDAGYLTPVQDYIELFTAIENGDDVDLQEPIVIDEHFFAALDEFNGPSLAVERSTVIDTNAIIDGEGITISRTAETAGDPLFLVKNGYSLTLSNITLDGGAIWAGETDPTLLRGTVNNGIAAGAAIISTEGNAKLVLNEGTVVQNNAGANAISLATRGSGMLTLNGAHVINNTSAAGAIWGGDDVLINEGTVINYNHATSIGGAFRMVNGYNAITFTMNGGEINHNKSDGTGGAIWGGNNATYVFNGGEMAYNYAVSGGGAIWTGVYETYVISGDFKLHDNSTDETIGGAIRFSDHASLTMTGGEVYNNFAQGKSDAFFLNNNSATITGGTIKDNFPYSGGLGLTIGEANIEGVIHYNLGTNHHTAYLAESFNSFEFTVEDAHVGNFNFKPATGYVYTDGDEAKLICMNEGYSTYWDAATSTFKLMADAVSE